MKVRIGDLARAEFDDGDVVCLVVGLYYSGPNKNSRSYKIMYWRKSGTTVDINYNELSANRLIRVKPKDENWNGAIKDLTLDSVVEINSSETEEGVRLGGCYHDGVAYTTGYRTGHGDDIELDDQLFTTFDTGINGGVAGELNHLRASFDPAKDVPRFAVALKPVKIIENNNDQEAGCEISPLCEKSLEDYCRSDYELDFCDDENEDSGNAGCDMCGINDRAPGSKFCDECIEEMCPDCEELLEDCCCEDGDDEDYCFGCDNYQYCDCNDDDDWLDCEKCGGSYETCECEDICGQPGCWCDPEVATPPLNAFARARWLKADRQ